MAGENGLRFVSAGLLAFLSAGSYAFALAIVVGFAASAVPLLAWRAREPQPAASPVDSSVAWAGSLAGLSAYSILVLGPTFLAVGGADAATVSVVFIVLAVYRAPFQITMGSAPRIMYLFEVSGRRPFAATPRGVMTLVLTASVGVGVLVAVVGDGVLGSIFGIGGVMAPLDHSLAAVLSIVGTGAIVATLALMATRIHAPVVVAWTIPAAIALTTLHLGGFSTTGTLLVLIVAALVTLGALLRLWDERDRGQPPSSI